MSHDTEDASERSRHKARGRAFADALGGVRFGGIE